MNKFLLFLLAGVLITTACENADKSSSETSAATQIAAGTSEVAVEAKVTIYKYSSYQCPACAYYHSFMKQLKQDYGNDVNIVPKHFPLNNQSYSHLAARTAEAAKAQGKFAEMHELIFAGQEQWSRGNAEAIFISYAESLELDMEKFRFDINSADINRIVIADRREGMDLGVNSTPTFYINGDKIEENPGSYPLFKELVESYMD